VDFRDWPVISKRARQDLRDRVRLPRPENSGFIIVQLSCSVISDGPCFSEGRARLPSHPVGVRLGAPPAIAMNCRLQVRFSFPLLVHLPIQSRRALMGQGFDLDIRMLGRRGDGFVIGFDRFPERRRG
jgi:hypothetical protein